MNNDVDFDRRHTIKAPNELPAVVLDGKEKMRQAKARLSVKKSDSNHNVHLAEKLGGANAKL